MFRMFWLSLALLLCAGCKESNPETTATPESAAAPAATADALLEDISGVWRVEHGALLYLLHEQGKAGMFIGDGEVPVRLGSIDLEQSTVNFTLPAGGEDVVWTVRKLSDKERDGFHLLLTLNDGQQQTLGFVRKVSDEDRRHLTHAAQTHWDVVWLGSLLASGEGWEDLDVEDRVNEGAVEEAATEVASVADEPAGGDDATSTAADGGSQAPSFDCSKPLNTAEQLVCDDPELAELDRKLSQSLRTLLGISKQPEAERAIHMRWLAETRNRCVKARCLRKAYESRLEVFKGANAYSEHVE